MRVRLVSYQGRFCCASGCWIVFEAGPVLCPSECGAAGLVLPGVEVSAGGPPAAGRGQEAGLPGPGVSLPALR